MGRARGANASLALAFESTYGVPPASGFFRTPFTSINLGEEQGLIPSDLLGFGRDPQQPGRAEVDAVGDAGVPLCARNIGLWLKLLLGAPTTTAGIAATGSYTFSAQPANSATITVGGQAFTFVTGTPTANQIKIGATLAETIANAVVALNASVVAGVAVATYRADANVIRITYDTLGTSGNAMTIVAGSSPASNATASGATLSGGAASGAYNHVFVSGAQDLPSASLQIGMPEVPRFAMNWGVKANTLAIPLQRSGLANATIGMIGQGETGYTTNQAGTPTELALARFSQFSGLIRRNGVPIGDLVSGAFNLGNGLDPVPSLRGDGRIGGVDEGALTVTGQAGIRFGSTELQIQAENGDVCELEHAWSIPNSVFALRAVAHQVYLPRAKMPITGPGGVQADYPWQGAEHPTLGRTATVTLVNDVANY